MQPTLDAPTNSVRYINAVEQDSRLYDEILGEQGIGYIRPLQTPSRDLIVALSPHATTQVERTGHLPSGLSSETLRQYKRLWICETGSTQEITLVVRLHEGRPLRLYALTNPVPGKSLPLRHIETGDLFNAPSWLNRDYKFRTYKVW